MRVVLTGHAGFIGSHTLEALIDKGHEVVGVDDMSTGKMENIRHMRDKFKHVRMDISTEGRRLAYLFGSFKPEAVIHLAAQSALFVSEKNPERDAEVNIQGTLNLIRVANKNAVERLVFSSTSAVYRKNQSPFKEVYTTLDPDRPYGISKLAAECYIRSMFQGYGSVLRYGNVYGPRQVPIGDNQLIARAFSAIYDGEYFRVFGDGKQTRDFIYVDDVVRANLKGLEVNRSGVYNVATGKGVTVKDVLHMVRENTGTFMPFLHIDAKDQEPTDVVLDIRRGAAMLRWYPLTNIQEGIRETAKWWKARE